MYFYCWVEICTNHVDCAQRCAIICEYIAVCFTLYTVCSVVKLFALSYHSIWGWETEKGGNVQVRPGPAGLFGAIAAGTEQHRTGGQSMCETEHKSVLLGAKTIVTVWWTKWQYLNENVFLCSSVFQVTVYMLSGVGAALLSILLFTVWSSIRKRQKPEAQQGCDAQVKNEQSQ